LQWFLELVEQEVKNADEQERRNAMLVLIVKFLHELQHRATWLFFSLKGSRRIAAPSDQSPRSSRKSSKVEAPLQMPECVGSMKLDGKRRGDSGYALEEKLLGGRLRHRNNLKRAHFHVSRHFHFLVVLLPTLTYLCVIVCP